MATDPIAGAIKLRDVLNLQCITNGADFAKALVDNMLIQLPGGLDQGVHVGPNQPVSPASTGIWVRINAAGTFVGLYVYSGGAWMELDLGGCGRPPTNTGDVLVCFGGLSNPLTGVTTGDVLTLEIGGTANATYAPPSDNGVGGSDGLTTLGSKLLSLGDPFFTSTIIDITIANTSAYRNKLAGLVACFTAQATTAVPDGEYMSVTYDLQHAFDGGAYFSLASYIDHTFEPAGLSNLRLGRQVNVAVPLTTGVFPMFPGGSTVLHLRGVVHLSYPGASGTGTLNVDSSFISSLVTELNV